MDSNGSPLSGAKISARGVERWFGLETGRPVHALGPLDLDIADGEFVCIVGPSGCGKSTFLRNVAGLLRPTKGTIDIRIRKPARQAIAMVFQEYSIYPWKTVLKNVRLGLEVSGMPRATATQRARHYLDKLDLSEFADAYPDTLSGGMKQRVSIARALAVEPEILLMDEPFAALDAQLRQILQDELLALWQADRRTVLFVTHSLEEAILLGDRVVVMSARPGTVLESVQVPFPRPRTSDIRNAVEFTALREDLWSLLRHEVELNLATSAHE